jgi:hypothetical protein
VRYVAPFVLFLLMLGLVGHLPISPAITLPLWFFLLLPVCIVCWPKDVPILPTHWVGSIGVGTVALVLWIAPELLVSGYRNLPLFSNALLGHVHSSLPEGALHSRWVLAWRTARAVIIVPIVEELFWRGWLMRWLIDNDFERVPLGTYAPAAFWISAFLFASEHGAYWDVGLITGAIYNLWMVRTKSLADCVVMHAVTNGLLSAYVIYAGQWQYWQ